MVKNLWNIVYCSICFFFIICAYSTLNNLSTIIFQKKLAMGNVGFYMVAIVNLTNAFAGFFCSPLVTKLSNQKTMILGGISVIIWCGSFIVPTTCVLSLNQEGICSKNSLTALLFLTSFINGLFFVPLIFAEGLYLIECAVENNLHFMQGLFLIIFNLSITFGNLCAFFILQNENYFLSFVFTMTFFSAVGTFLLLFLPKPHDLSGKEYIYPKVDNPIKEVVYSKLSETFSLLFSTKSVSLYPMMSFIGLNLVILGGVFPQLVFRKILENNPSTPSYMIEKQVALFMTFYGISISLTSLIIMKYGHSNSKKFDSYLMLSLSAVVILACYIFYYFINVNYTWIAIPSIIGSCMACYNILLGVLATKESKDPKAIFSVYGFLATISRFLGLFSFSFIKNVEPKYYLIPFFGFAIMTLILEAYLIRKYDKKETKQE